ncbi:hypothetical protein EMIT0158MI4_70006 [Burkholderia ambifaria]
MRCSATPASPRLRRASISRASTAGYAPGSRSRCASPILPHTAAMACGGFINCSSTRSAKLRIVICSGCGSTPPSCCSPTAAIRSSTSQAWSASPTRALSRTRSRSASASRRGAGAANVTERFRRTVPACRNAVAWCGKPPLFRAQIDRIGSQPATVSTHHAFLKPRPHDAYFSEIAGWADYHAVFERNAFQRCARLADDADARGRTNRRRVRLRIAAFHRCVDVAAAAARVGRRYSSQRGCSRR